MSTTRGKTTPASTSGSFAAKAGASSRVEVPGWDTELTKAFAHVAAGCDTPEEVMVVVDGALAAYSMQCDECAQGMWIDSNGVAFHDGAGPDGIDHDLDGDHVAYCEDLEHFDPDEPAHEALLEAVTDVCEGFPQHGHDIRTVCRNLAGEHFATLIAERRTTLRAAARDHATNTAPRRWGINVLIDGPSSKHVVGRWANDHVVAVVLDDFGQPGTVNCDAYEQLVDDTRYANGDPDHIIVYGHRYTYQTDGVTFRHLAADGRTLTP